MLQRYDIVLVPFPFTDGSQAKPRPAMVVALGERHGDVLLAFISSQVRGLASSDELEIPAGIPDFEQSGLKVSSRLRLTRMTTLSWPLVRRRIGVLPTSLRPAYHQLIRTVLLAESGHGQPLPEPES
jgi:mRNA interferase MazF